MSTVKIDAAIRSDFGKGAARQLRRHGRIPAVVYGGDIEVQHVSLPDHDLMMALKRAQVILEIDLDGKATNVAPRQVQKDPVRQVIEHVDLVVLSAQEVRERLVVGQAVAAAEARAAEEELDPVTVTIAMRELLDEGVEVDDAINQAVEQVKEELAAQAAAAAAAAAAEDAAAEAEAESGEEASAEAGAGDEDYSEE
ncbi:MAG: 50S ribosomal protein L25 [Candidatus Nanopelagicales bacterium]